MPVGIDKISVKLLGVTFTFSPNDEEKKAAWSLYVELRTRVAVRQFAGEYGLMRGALDSLYSLFSTTREVLREATDVLMLRNIPGSPDFSMARRAAASTRKATSRVRATGVPLGISISPWI